MSEYKTEISHDDYLKALALFHMASESYRAAARYGEALNRIIMVAPEKFPGGHVDDAIYSDERPTVEHFDEALRREKINVMAPADATQDV